MDNSRVDVAGTLLHERSLDLDFEEVMITNLPIDYIKYITDWTQAGYII